ncbi:unnamed protein product [Trichobilharzia regenti]|nr:unnamed protein product [Trichobilharzia regenti]
MVISRTGVAMLALLALLDFRCFLRLAATDIWALCASFASDASGGDTPSVLQLSPEPPYLAKVSGAGFSIMSLDNFLEIRGPIASWMRTCNWLLQNLHSHGDDGLKHLL